MGGLQQYALTVVTGAMICSVLMAIVPCGSHRERIRLLCGLYLGILILYPLAQTDWNPELSVPSLLSSEAVEQAAAGKDLARRETEEIISQRVEAYILDKAALQDTDLVVTVSIGEDLLPVTVQLQGSVTDRQQEILSGILETDLGIAKENQRWIG